MKLKLLALTFILSLIFVPGRLIAQTISAEGVKVEITDEIVLDGKTRITGNSPEGEGRLTIDSDKPRILFSENDNTNDNFRMSVQDGAFSLDLTDDQFAATGLGLKIDNTGRAEYSGGLVVKDGFLALPRETALTINGGAITITGSRHKVDTQSAAPTDILKYIYFAGTPVDGAILFLQSVDGQRDITIQSGGGNIRSNDHEDTTLNTARVTYMLVYDAETDIWTILNPK